MYAYVPHFVLIGLFCRPWWRQKNTNFAVFGLRHFAVSPFGGNLRELNTVQKHNYTNLPLSKGTKSFLYSNAFMAKSGAQSLTFRSVTDKHTKTQRFCPPGGG